MNIDLLPDQALYTLRALATYQFLTPAQLVTAGISKNIVSLRNNTLNPLAKQRHPLIEFLDLGPIPGGGRYPKIFFLTKKGASLLADHLRVDLKEICFPRSRVQFRWEALHRLAFIDFHVHFRKWAEQNGVDVEFLDAYFEPDTTGIKRRGKPPSKIQMYIGLNMFEPDGMLLFHKDGKSRLCSLEIHHTTSTKDIVRQLGVHVTAIATGIPSQKYQYDKANFVLSVHSKRSTMEKTRSKLMELDNFSQFLPLFHFNLMDNIRNNFATGWTQANGKPSPIFA
jgi:hypothetical protein